MDPSPTRKTEDDDTRRHEPVAVQESHLHQEIDVSRILSAISGNDKNHPDEARILDSMTGSGYKDKKPPVVFVVVDDNNGRRNNAAINDQDYLPIRRSHQQQNRSMPANRPSGHCRTHRGVSPCTGFYHSDTDRRWVNTTSIPPRYEDMYMESFAKPYDDDLEMGTNRGPRDSAGKKSAAPAPRDVWQDNDEDSYYDYKYRHSQAYNNNANKASRRSMHDGAYYDIKKKQDQKTFRGSRL
jgi:hypothetical protein